ncbi:hypothetical protein ACLB2K_008242 [Fragaria x ananassa]
MGVQGRAMMGVRLKPQTHSFTSIVPREDLIVDLRSSVELKKKLKQSGVAASPELVVEILSRFRNDWESAFTCAWKCVLVLLQSFNIVLNGWANIIGSPRNAERIWAEMTNRGVPHDAISYSCLISCHSKSSNLTKVLTIFRRMNKLNVEPDTKEKGLVPTIVTYSSLIKTLCKAGEIDQAKHILHQMMEQRGLVPTIQTYHPFFRVVTTADQVFELLEKMKSTGCSPNTDTYIVLIRKFCRWRQLDNVFKLWGEMSENGTGPDRSSYIVLIHGLFLNRKLEEAHKYYTEMIDKHYLPEPRTEEMLQAWFSGHISCKLHLARGKANDRGSVQAKKKKGKVKAGKMKFIESDSTSYWKLAHPSLQSP